MRSSLDQGPHLGSKLPGAGGLHPRKRRLVGFARSAATRALGKIRSSMRRDEPKFFSENFLKRPGSSDRSVSGRFCLGFWSLENALNALISVSGMTDTTAFPMCVIRTDLSAPRSHPDRLGSARVYEMTGIMLSLRVSTISSENPPGSELFCLFSFGSYTSIAVDFRKARSNHRRPEFQSSVRKPQRQSMNLFPTVSRRRKFRQLILLPNAAMLALRTKLQRLRYPKIGFRVRIFLPRLKLIAAEFRMGDLQTKFSSGQLKKTMACPQL